MADRASDFLVVGGGVLGLAIARELRRRHGDCSVRLLEKEKACGLHASGRNSGVLHAGFYYGADSLKARLCAEGNARMRAFCEERGIAVRACGKLVVAAGEGELGMLDALEARAAANGVAIERVDEAQARAIEPRVKTCGAALFSPATASVDPRAVVAALAREAADAGVAILRSTRWRGEGCGFLVNAAGLQADRVARACGHSKRYRVLPFKGLYLETRWPAGALATNVYPVPDLAFPFLGVHWTVAADGRAKLGPTALPAWGREAYHGLSGARDLAEVLAGQARMLLRGGARYRRLAVAELRKRSRAHLAALGARLLEGVSGGDFAGFSEPGIRAQLVDRRTGKLVMDFVLEGDARSLHVLNAVSPGFTCALPFAELVCDRIAELARR